MDKYESLSSVVVGKILEEIWHYADEKYMHFIKRSLQTQQGGYGYEDNLAGVRVPTLRKIAKKYKDIKLEDAENLLQNKLHEARFTALIILIDKFKKNQKEVFEIYIINARMINNWDLVDVSASNILGAYCLNSGNNDEIWRFANSTELWKNRMAIVSSLAFIKVKDIQLTLDLCKHFIPHKHHLIWKASGWMLREVGKKNESSLINFLDEHKENLPKITVSYAKEHLRKRITF